MTHSKSTTDPDGRSAILLRAILVALAILPLGCNKDEQQASKEAAVSAQSEQPAIPPSQITPPQPASAPAAKPLTD